MRSVFLVETSKRKLALGRSLMYSLRMDILRITILIANKTVKRYIHRIENDDQLDRAIQDEVAKVSAMFNALPDSVKIHGA
jgi:hypothetical protein